LIEYSVKLIGPGSFISGFGAFFLVRGLAGYTAVVEIKKHPRALKRLIAGSRVA